MTRAGHCMLGIGRSTYTVGSGRYSHCHYVASLRWPGDQPFKGRVAVSTVDVRVKELGL